MTPGRLPDPEAGPGAPADGPGMRFLDGLAGLLAAGVLVVGALLLLAALLAPSVLAAAELGTADGPGWDRVVAHLGVGLAGEAVVRFRRRWPTAVRVGADVAVVLAAVVVVGWGWWP